MYIEPRSRRLALAISIGMTLAVAVSCGVLEDEPTPTPTALPTATPTTVPTPVAGPPVETLPMYLGSLGRTNAYDTEPAAKGVVKWKFQVVPRTTSSPVIDDGVVYFGSGIRLMAVDAATGEEIWRFETEDTVRSSPAVSDGVVFIGSYDGHLYAVDAKTGQEVWKFKTGDRVLSSPAVTDGTVLFGSKDGHLYAVDTATGEERWKFQTGEPKLATEQPDDPEAWDNFLPGVFTSPAVADGLVIFGASDLNYYAVDLETGQQRWTFETGGSESLFATPAIADGVVYVPEPFGELGAQGPFRHVSLLALDAKTGEEQWRFDLGEITLANGVAVSEGVAYVGIQRGTPGSGKAPAFVSAIDVQTKQELWRQNLGKTAGLYNAGLPEAPVNSIPAVAGNVVYIGNTQRNFHALFKGTGDAIWDIEISALVNSSPTIADGVVYFTGMDGFLYAVE